MSDRNPEGNQNSAEQNSFDESIVDQCRSATCPERQTTDQRKSPINVGFPPHRPALRRRPVCTVFYQLIPKTSSLCSMLPDTASGPTPITSRNQLPAPFHPQRQVTFPRISRLTAETILQPDPFPHLRRDDSCIGLLVGFIASTNLLLAIHLLNNPKSPVPAKSPPKRQRQGSLGYRASPSNALQLLNFRRKTELENHPSHQPASEEVSFWGRPGEGFTGPLDHCCSFRRKNANVQMEPAILSTICPTHFPKKAWSSRFQSIFPPEGVKLNRRWE